MQMEMEALVAKLRLTSISSAHETIGYAPRQGDAHAATMNTSCVMSPDEARTSQTDQEEPFYPDLWEGECG